MSNLCFLIADLRIYVPTFMEEHNFFVPFILSIMNEHWVWSPNTMHHSHLTSLRDKTTTTTRLNRTHELLDNSRPTGLTYAAYIRLSQQHVTGAVKREIEKWSWRVTIWKWNASGGLHLGCYLALYFLFHREHSGVGLRTWLQVNRVTDNISSHFEDFALFIENLH